MITIQFGRYRHTLNTVRCKSGKIYNAFESVIDHQTVRLDSDTTLDKLMNSAHSWLDNHFGFVIVIMDNVSELDMPIKFKICNYKKMKAFFAKSGIELRLGNHIS